MIGIVEETQQNKQNVFTSLEIPLTRAEQTIKNRRNKISRINLCTWMWRLEEKQEPGGEKFFITCKVELLRKV
jgi:hypothetical protein